MTTAPNSTPAASAKSPILSDLTIRGFCGIRELTVECLGYVTLIAGENGVGKTTLLDAVRVYANRGSKDSLIDLLERRDELHESQNVKGDPITVVRWPSLFYGRTMAANAVIAIGPRSEDAQLIMRLYGPRIDDNEIPGVTFSRPEGRVERTWALRAKHGNKESISFMSPESTRRGPLGDSGDESSSDPDSGTKCVTIGPGLLSNRQTRSLWSAVALTRAEEEVVAALNLLAGQYGEIERIAFIGDEPYIAARPIVRRAGEDEPIPVRSLGDGAVRALEIVLALVNCAGGFLLIDEVENGIHYSVQESLWKMILESARHNNVQVLATTHSWDAVAGFAIAASRDDAADGRLIRLERRGDEMRAVEYTEEELVRVAETGSEVR